MWEIFVRLSAVPQPSPEERTVLPTGQVVCNDCFERLEPETMPQMLTDEDEWLEAASWVVAHGKPAPHKEHTRPMFALLERERMS